MTTTMKGQHTIERVNKPNGDMIHYRIADADGIVFAHAFDDEDARLIAAAPEMVDVLSKLVRASARISGSNPLDGLCDEARALLAKIEGK